MIALFQHGRDDPRPSPTCGGADILDLALGLIVSVAVVGLLLLVL